MGIKGLTSSVRPDIPRLGKIRKGDEKVDDRRPGKDLDYFRITTDRAGLGDEILKLYGAEPRELRVVLPYPSIEEVFDPWMKEYGATGLKRQCDGEKQYLWLPEGGNAYRGVQVGDEPIPCLQATKGCKCQRNAPLKVILPELFALGRCGYFEVCTSSKHDILHIQGSLEYVYAMRGSLLGVPFILRRVTEQKSYPKPNGGRGLKEYHLIKMEVDPAWLQQKLHEEYSIEGSLPPQLPQRQPLTYAAVQAQLEGTQDELESIPVQTVEVLPPTAEESILEELSSEIGEQVKRLGMGRSEASELLKARYGKATRSELTPDEALDFLEYLKQLNPVTA